MLPGQASQQALQALLLVLAQPERAELRCEVLLVLPRLVGPPRCKMFCRFLSEKHQFDSHFRSDSLWGKLCSSVECRIFVTEFWCPVDVSWSCDVKARHLRSGCCGWSGFGRQWCLCVQCGCAGQQFGHDCGCLFRYSTYLNMLFHSKTIKSNRVKLVVVLLSQTLRKGTSTGKPFFWSG